jgi:hypothetical protein
VLNKSLAALLILLALFLTFLAQRDPAENRPVKESLQIKPVNQPELIKLIKKDLAGEKNLRIIKINQFNISCLRNSCAAYPRSSPKEIVLVTEKNKSRAYQKILNYINQ